MNLVRWNNQPRFTNLFDHALFNDELLNDYQTVKYRKPAANIIENENNFELVLAVPGFGKDEIKIDLEDNLLTISSEKEVEDKEINFSRREFAFGAFSRSFKLPKTVEAEKIKAEFKDGILNINIPKIEEAKLKKVIKIS
jgi:HSP20 family protein